jgi:hypothetical protein
LRLVGIIRPMRNISPQLTNRFKTVAPIAKMNAFKATAIPIAATDKFEVQ